MLQNMVNKIVAHFCSTRALNPDRKDWYVYTVEKYISTSVSLIILLILGGFLSGIGPTLVFISGFALLRRQSGGYHVKAYWGCLGLSALTVCVNHLLVVPLLMAWPKMLTIIAASLCATIFIVIGVVGHPNLWLPAELMAKKRNRLLYTALLQYIFIAFFTFLPQLRLYACHLTTGMFFAAISLCVGKQLYKQPEGERKYAEEKAGERSGRSH